jgi:hypothetical protein
MRTTQAPRNWRGLFLPRCIEDLKRASSKKDDANTRRQ